MVLKSFQLGGKLCNPLHRREIVSVSISKFHSIPVVQIYIRHAFTECVNLVSDVNHVSIRAMITLQVKTIVLNFQYDKICDCRKIKIKI